MSKETDTWEEDLSFTPPTENEIIKYFGTIIKKKNIIITDIQAMAIAENYLMYRDDNGWMKANGNLVKSWKLDFNTWVNNMIISGKLTSRSNAQW